MSDTDTEQTIEEQDESPLATGAAQAPVGGVSADGEIQDEVVVEGEVLEGEVVRDEAEEDAVEVEEDLDELEVLAAKRDEYLALAQRTQADFENYRKRVARDAATAAERGVAKLARELLPALDNLDRALDAAAQDDPLLDGVRLVRGELSSGLARVGIESFGAAGDTFDPVEHEAVAQQPVEGAASGSVVEVYQPGYRLGASIIRPARVLVAA
ncbi:MAG TPA: nucleotide exchange factor GrpE [Solirubrobacteraceae bacterium]